MKIALALVFTIFCYAGDCLASSPNVLTGQDSFSADTVKKGKGGKKGKKGKKKGAPASGEHAG